MAISLVKIFNFHKVPERIYKGPYSMFDYNGKTLIDSTIRSHTGASYFPTGRSINELIQEKAYPEFFFKEEELKEKTILDVGTGKGQTVLEMRNLGANAFGIDIFPYEEHAKNPQYFTIADAADTKFPDKSFDMIYSAYSIFSFKDETIEFREKVLNEMKRILKDGGKIRLGALIDNMKGLVNKVGGLEITKEDPSIYFGNWVEITKI